jgi:hypothetical protein
MWSYKGHTHYLERQANRLGVPPILSAAAKHNAEIFKASTLLAQLCERYHKARKEFGRPVFGAVERVQIAGTLAQAELKVQQLHLLAAAAAAMVDEAHAELGIPQPPRHFIVLSDFDVSPSLPLGDGTVGVAAEALEPAFISGG